MYQHTGIGDVVGVEIGDFKVIGRFGRFELLQRYAFYFAKRAVGKKNFIAMLQVAGRDPLLAQTGITCVLRRTAVLLTILYRRLLLLSRREKRKRASLPLSRQGT